MGYRAKQRILNRGILNGQEANQNDPEIPSYTIKCLHVLVKMWSKESTPPLPMGGQTYTTTLETNLVVSQKIGNSST